MKLNLDRLTLLAGCELWVGDDRGTGERTCFCRSKGRGQKIKLALLMASQDLVNGKNGQIETRRLLGRLDGEVGGRGLWLGL